MQRSTIRSSFGRRAPRPLAFVLTVAAAIATGNIHAQVVVTDPAEESTSSAAATFAKITAYAKQVQQYEQMLTSAINLNMSSLIPNAPLQQISDPGSLIQAKCNSSSGGGVLGSLMTSLASLVSGPMDQSQKAICAQIVTTQVDKYNRTVAMMNQLNNYASSLQTLQSNVSNFANMGQSSSTTTAAAGYSAQLQTEMNNWESQMKADDAIIKTLSDQQSLLSSMALNGGGSSSIVGNSGLPNTTFQDGLNGVSTDVP